MKVYLVLHERYVSKEEEATRYQGDIKIIGVYSTRKDAQEAVKRLTTQPGFRDTPDGFFIDEYVVNEDNWSEGFSLE